MPLVPELNPELNQFFNNTRVASALEPDPNFLNPPVSPTGVDWLDTFLEGGLAQNRVNLLDWAEGTEKLQKLVLDSLFAHGFLGVSGEESVRDLLEESNKFHLVIHPFKMNGQEAASFFPARRRGHTAPTLVLSCLTTPTSVATKFASSRRLRFTETQVRVVKDTISTLQGRVCPVPSLEKNKPVRSRFNRPPVV